MSKCEFYDKGYCKEKNNCPKKHPTNDCDGQCDDLKLCPSRHRKHCKNGENCAFHASHSCEFLHKKEGPLHGVDIEKFQSDLKNIDIKVKAVDNILENFEKTKDVMEGLENKYKATE